MVEESRNRIYKTVNTEMINLYWNIGKMIVEMQEGNTKAKYGDYLIERVSKKLSLELGKGFTYVGNQVRITLDTEHYYPDLVFYNRILKCFVIIDLKIDKVTHKDIGQMQMYVNYYDRDIKLKDENKTIGILLYIDKNEKKNLELV